MTFVDQFIAAVIATSLLEWIGVVTSLLYVVFAARKHILCWLFGFISSAIYVYLAFQTKLFIDSGLQLFYVVMSVYGWLKWNKNSEKEKQIVSRKMNYHIKVIAAGMAAAFLIGFIFDEYTPQASPYLDGSIAAFSLVATFMTANKVLENWVYWIVVDFAAIFLFESRGMALTAVLYLIYTLMAIYALWQWTIFYKRQNNPENHSIIN